MARPPDFNDFALIPHDQFISGRAKLFSAKAGPMAVVSTRGPMAVLSRQKQPDGQTSRFLLTRGPMAVLSRQKQPDGQTSRFQRQIAFSPLSRTISLSAEWPFYQREAQWPFYQEQRPDSQTPDLSRGLQVPQNPAQSIYQRPGQAIFSRSKPSGRFVTAGGCKLAKSGPIAVLP